MTPASFDHDKVEPLHATRTRSSNWVFRPGRHASKEVLLAWFSAVRSSPTSDRVPLAVLEHSL